MRSKRQLNLFLNLAFILLLIGGAFIPIAAQNEPDLTQLESEVAVNKAKAAENSLKADEQEKLLNLIAYQINQIAEIRFNKGEYEAATKLFVEADLYISRYHESYYARQKQELEEAEKSLVEYAKEPNQLKRETILKAGRVVVSAVLSILIREAQFFSDAEAEKKYLQRLGEVSRDMSDAKGEADSYEKNAVIELNNGNSKTAFELFEKAMALRKTINHEWWTLDYIAFAHWQTGDYARAAERFEEEIEILREQDKKPVEVKLDLPAGLELSEKELAERRERKLMIATLEKSVVRTSLAAALYNLAQLRNQQGKYGAATKAITEIQALIDQMRKEHGAAKDETVRAVLQLSSATHQASVWRIRGRIFEAQGKDAEALKNYADAVDLFSQLAAGEPSGAVAALRGRMALIYLNQNKFDEARANVRETMRLRARLHQEAGTVFALIFGSRIERAAKQPEAALKFARQAKAAALQLNNAEDVLAEANETEADALLDKATDANPLALEQAIVGYRSAIEVYRPSELKPLLARALNSLGAAYERAGKPKEAEAAYTEAVQIVETIRSGFSSSEESDAYSSRRDTTEIYQRLVDLLVKQGRAEQALQYATRAQRRDLIDAAPKAEIKLEGKAAETLKAAAVAEQRVEAVRSNLEKARLEPASGSQRSNLVSALGAARQDYALAIKRLEIEQPNLRFTVRPTDLLKLQTSVAPNEAIISYLVTPDKLFIFVVRRNNVAVRPVEINQNDLRALIAEAREGLNNFADDFYALSSDAETGFAEEKARADLRRDDKSDHYQKTLAPINASLVKLHERLIKPVDDLLAGADTLKIIPNAELFLLPFAALVAPEDKGYLLEKYNIVFLTAGDLIAAPQKAAGGSLVAFGNPTEANLDGALEEVKAIRAVFPRSQIFTLDAATKEQLFKLTSAKILHLATHGHIRSPLEASNIQLAHLPGKPQPDLSYGEIYALPLEASEMVVLSACQTALGTVSGTEVGVFIEAFRTKTSTVAASLWSVDDLATRELMTNFYRNLAAGQTRAAAIRNAQLKLLRDGRTKNPLFWGAFVLYGDGGKLSGAPLAAPIKKAK